MSAEKAKKLQQSKKNLKEVGPPNLHLSEDWQCLSEEYRVTELIGSGSFGCVYKANHLQSGRTVAIKRIDDIF